MNQALVHLLDRITRCLQGPRLLFLVELVGKVIRLLHHLIRFADPKYNTGHRLGSQQGVMHQFPRHLFHDSAAGLLDVAEIRQRNEVRQVGRTDLVRILIFHPRDGLTHHTTSHRKLLHRLDHLSRVRYFHSCIHHVNWQSLRLEHLESIEQVCLFLVILICDHCQRLGWQHLKHAIQIAVLKLPECLEPSFKAFHHHCHIF
mmetsp:Transcript_61959/g.138055  ORF Transcript_61959/g.138055 Transcript_61959/m.138055 type:complete len:202 (-) Transcript_61959:872-1477(-)